MLRYELLAKSYIIKENSYRSIGIYSNNSLKFIRGYDTLVKDLGNYLPKEKGIQEIIEATREVNDEGLLSIISHSTNKIFDQNHGKGSLGSAIAAIIYKGKNPNSILVGLDTQLAKEWLSERDDGHLPDLIGINLSDESQSDVTVDIIEVKTYKAFEIDEGHKTIKGDAVNQVSVIEALILEMFSKTEKSLPYPDVKFFESRFMTLYSKQVFHQKSNESMLCN